MAPRFRRTAMAGLVVFAAMVFAACTPDGAAPPTSSATTASGPAQVTLAVYGPPPVIAAYRKIAARYMAKHATVVVTLKPYPDHLAAITALRSEFGTPQAPDVFLSEESDLAMLLSHHAIQQVDQMMADRNVDLGDGYERVGLEAFSADSALQCMPVDVSPLVVYYNARLIHLAKIRPPGQVPPNSDDGWLMSDFEAAAQQASTRATRGVYVDPDLEQVAPFVFSGGGQMVDDNEQPTTLTLSSGSSTNAMRQLLQVVRNPNLTFTAQQLAASDALARFKAGTLGMIVGDRTLTPTLRQQPGLVFGVMPMPKVKNPATVADVSGFCVRHDVADQGAVGDFLAYLVGSPASRVLATTGYVTPANLDALHSDAFVQPLLDPIGADVFSSQMRYVHDLPDTVSWERVRAATAPELTHLFYDPVIDPLEARLSAIDLQSQPLFGPPPGTSPSPSS